MMTRSLAEMDRLITAHLPQIRALPFDVVVHIPRSGTLPAALIATYLRRPLASVEEFCRGIVSTRKSDTLDTRRILLVDDSIRTGVQMQAAIDRLRDARYGWDLVTLAVFATDVPRKLQPTLVLSRHSDRPYVYPWFMWKTKRVRECAFDLDGVFCRDCTSEEDDDGDRYREFLRTAEPKFLTGFRVGAVITSRLDKYRAETVEWLQRHGVEYGALIMGPWASAAERRGRAASWKASIYRRRHETLYVESDDRAARLIAESSGKPVWSIERQERHG